MFLFVLGILLVVFLQCFVPILVFLSFPFSNHKFFFLASALTVFFLLLYSPYCSSPTDNFLFSVPFSFSLLSCSSPDTAPLLLQIVSISLFFQFFHPVVLLTVYVRLKHFHFQTSILRLYCYSAISNLNKFQQYKTQTFRSYHVFMMMNLII